MTISESILQTLAELRWTPYQLSTLTDIPYSTLTDFLSGNGSTSFDNVLLISIAIADAQNREVGEVVGELTSRMETNLAELCLGNAKV